MINCRLFHRPRYRPPRSGRWGTSLLWMSPNYKIDDSLGNRKQGEKRTKVIVPAYADAAASGLATMPSACAAASQSGGATQTIRPYPPRSSATQLAASILISAS